MGGAQYSRGECECECSPGRRINEEQLISTHKKNDIIDD